MNSSSAGAGKVPNATAADCFPSCREFQIGPGRRGKQERRICPRRKMKAAANGGWRRRSRPGGDPGNCPPDGNGCHRRGDPGNRPLPDRVFSRDGGDPNNPPGEGSPEGKKDPAQLPANKERI